MNRKELKKMVMQLLKVEKVCIEIVGRCLWLVLFEEGLKLKVAEPFKYATSESEEIFSDLNLFK